MTQASRLTEPIDLRGYAAGQRPLAGLVCVTVENLTHLSIDDRVPPYVSRKWFDE
tara:strand:+ start:377 stop:541 length:165 start_codon:yes stop_codon:yes gene_type:complete